jgi:hypothetical protein
MSELARDLAPRTAADWREIERVLGLVEPRFVDMLPAEHEIGIRDEGTLFRFVGAGVILARLAGGEVVRMTARDPGEPMHVQAWDAHGRELVGFNVPVAIIGASFN